MEKELVDLLEALKKAQKNIITFGELEDQGIDGVFIKEAGQMGIIRNASNENIPISDKENRDFKIVLTIRGFEYLNPIRIKKATEQLDASIKNFNDSSNKAYNQLNDSIKKFNVSSDKYSKELIGLTRAIYFLTIILIILTTYTVTKDIVDEKTFALIPFFNSNAQSALVYAGILDIGIVVLMFSVSEKLEKLINYFKRK